MSDSEWDEETDGWDTDAGLRMLLTWAELELSHLQLAGTGRFQVISTTVLYYYLAWLEASAQQIVCIQLCFISW